MKDIDRRHIHPSKEKACPHAFQSHWPPNVTVDQISDTIRKNSVPLQGIESHSLAIVVSILTARPPRILIANKQRCRFFILAYFHCWTRIWNRTQTRTQIPVICRIFPLVQI